VKRILICTGVLGGGTALVFAAAVAASALFPNGGTIAATNQQVFMKGGVAFPAGANFGGGFTTGGVTTTTVNADGSVTVTGGAVPVPPPVPVQAPDASPGP
jgi:hypothetical protein